MKRAGELCVEVISIWKIFKYTEMNETDYYKNVN